MKSDIKNSWKNARHFSRIDFRPEVSEWLLFPGSFTRKAKAYSSYKMPFTIRVLSERLELAKLNSYEYQLFDCRYIFIREVQIFLGEHNLMYARSAMPKTAAILYKWNFRGLGRKPLGEILFNKYAFKRSQFEIAKIGQDNPEFYLATDSESLVEPFLWARRSVFSLDVNILLLTEFFSPHLTRYFYGKYN